MNERTRWFDRTFELGLEPERFPEILTRLRSTPERLRERVAGLTALQLTRQPSGAWSIQENVGHLLDLEPLWAGRLDDLLARVSPLRPADLENRATHEADHNAAVLDDLLERFQAVRHALVDRCDRLTPDELSIQSLHPRLQQPMSAVDLFFFVAEHDDHHVTTIDGIRAGLG